MSIICAFLMSFGHAPEACYIKHLPTPQPKVCVSGACLNNQPRDRR